MSGRNRPRELWSDEEASSALEFAILGPVFLMLIFGVIGLGWTIHAVSNVNYVAERVGRVLQLNPKMSEADITTTIRGQLSYLDPKQLTITLNKDSAGGINMGHANVRYDLVYDVPFVGSFPVSYRTSVSVPLV